MGIVSPGLSIATPLVEKENERGEEVEASATKDGIVTISLSSKIGSAGTARIKLAGTAGSAYARIIFPSNATEVLTTTVSLMVPKKTKFRVELEAGAFTDKYLWSFAPLN